MNNVIAHPATANADRAIGALREVISDIDDKEEKVVKRSTPLQLRRQIARLKRDIAREVRHQRLESERDALQAKLSDITSTAR